MFYYIITDLNQLYFISYQFDFDLKSGLGGYSKVVIEITHCTFEYK